MSPVEFLPPCNTWATDSRDCGHHRQQRSCATDTYTRRPHSSPASTPSCPPGEPSQHERRCRKRLSGVLLSPCPVTPGRESPSRRCGHLVSVSMPSCHL